MNTGFQAVAAKLRRARTCNKTQLSREEFVNKCHGIEVEIEDVGKIIPEARYLK